MCITCTPVSSEARRGPQIMSKCKLNLVPMQEQQMLLTTAICLQSCPSYVGRIVKNRAD